MPTAKEMCQLLDLAPHPEGGYYRETFRDCRLDTAARAASTAIYFLLEAGQVSRWHRVDAAEVWHFYAGDALELSLAMSLSDPPRAHFLGADIVAGQTPQVVVPAQCWQQARSLGQWTLVGCTVAPGFTFGGLEMAPLEFDPRAGGS